jgi:chromosome partitioning protein
MQYYKVITVAQQKGGAGKTTIAAHLAVALSQRGKRVTAIDIDPQGSFTKWHEIRKEKYGADFTGMNFITVSGWRLQNEINMIKYETDVIIIDSPPHMQTETKTAIRAADLVIIPAQPSPTDLWATEATVQLVKAEHVPYRILMNRCVQNSKISQDMANRFENTMDIKIGNRVNFASVLLDGKCITETAPASPAACEIKSLLKETEALVFPAVKKGRVKAAA